MSEARAEYFEDLADFYSGEIDRLDALLSANLAEHGRAVEPAPRPAPQPRPYNNWRGLVLRELTEAWPTFDELLKVVKSKPRKPGISARDILSGTLRIMADDGLIQVNKEGRYSLTERGHNANRRTA